MESKNLTVFYSWQSDTSSNLGRSFIEDALKAAIKQLKAQPELESAFRERPLTLDKDTKGISGSPPITETIFRKIEQCEVFVADLTFVAESLKSIQTPEIHKRVTPNPNVLIEYGYALKCHGHERIITVMNAAFGKPDKEALPFDLRHLRWPMTYAFSGTPDEDKKLVFRKLVEDLKHALQGVLSLPRKLAASPPPALFVPQTATEDISVFTDDVDLLLPPRLGRPSQRPEIPNEGRAYLRLYPLHEVPELETELEAKILAAKGGLLPMGKELNGWEHDRNGSGAIALASLDKDALANFTQLFLTRELWGVDAMALNLTFCREFASCAYGYVASKYVETVYLETLTNYMQFATSHLKLPFPLKVEAGLTGIKGYRIAVENRMLGQCLTDKITWESVISHNLEAAVILEPFFKKMWGKLGAQRPANQSAAG